MPVADLPEGEHKVAQLISPNNMPQLVDALATRPPGRPHELRVHTSPHRLPLLATAEFVCQNARPAVHYVAFITSDFLDYGRSEHWKNPQACEKNDLRLLQRLTMRKPPSINRHMKAYFAKLGLVHAVKHENMDMIRWLHAYCPMTHAHDALVEAVKLRSLRVMERLADHYEKMDWTPSLGDAAVRNQDVQALE